MDRKLLNNIIVFIFLILAQVLICNHIRLFNVAMPFVFIYYILRMPMSTKTNILLTWAFCGGFLVDIFSDTLGLNSLSATLLAMAKRPLLYAYIPRDDRTKDISPSIGSMGFIDYSKFLMSMSLLYCFLVFSIEYFNFADVKEIVIMSASSALFTFLLLLGIDSIVVTKRNR